MNFHFQRIAVVAATIIVMGGLTTSGLGEPGAAAQDATPGDLRDHPLVGTWIVDTNIDSESDAPEIGIFTADGNVLGLGAGRWVSGAWEAADDATGSVTMAGVFDANGGGYVVLRGPHQVDETGAGWTCPCTFTVISPNGSVLDSGMATARATRLPIEPAEASGMPLAGFPIWTPGTVTDATPAA
jgi:hypothetical protein